MGLGSHAKFVPDAILTAPKDQIALFLNRLYATDGSAWTATSTGGRSGTGYGGITYCSVSERLARDVQHLLLRFGICAALRRRLVAYKGVRRLAFEVEITDSEGIFRFAAEIGIFGKEVQVARLIDLVNSRAWSPKRDTLPLETWTFLSAAAQARGMSRASLSRAAGKSGGHNWHVGNRSPQRRTVATLARGLRSPELWDLATSDVWWDEIVGIEDAGEDDVYDLTIPDLENFVADDVIVHNSTLAMNVAAHVAVEQRKPVAVFSLEMSEMELVQRIWAGEARVDLSRFKNGRMEETDWPKLSQAVGRLAEAKLFLDDNSAINLMEIRSKCRRIKQRHGLELVVIDYLQLMQSHRRQDNRVQEVSEISRGLKVLAKELSVPVIALSQLNRKSEDRTDRRPQLADLRDSGSIEQDADIVCFIYRDEVYHEDTDAKGEAELIVAKHRNGALRTIRLSFMGHHSRFANMARSGGPSGVF